MNNEILKIKKNMTLWLTVITNIIKINKSYYKFPSKKDFELLTEEEKQMIDNNNLFVFSQYQTLFSFWIAEMERTKVNKEDTLLFFDNLKIFYYDLEKDMEELIEFSKKSNIYKNQIYKQF